MLTEIESFRALARYAPEAAFRLPAVLDQIDLDAIHLGTALRYPRHDLARQAIFRCPDTGRKLQQSMKLHRLLTAPHESARVGRTILPVTCWLK